MRDGTMSALERRARWRVAHRIAFLGHLIVFGGVLLLLAALYFPAAVIVALAWGIGVAAHGFFAVAAPVLRDRWVDQELASVVPTVRTTERRASESRHAREVERLAASLAHEIRNPIAAAKSLVQQLAEDPASPDAPEYARVAAAELDRVEASIAHLLRFAREERLEPTSLALDTVIDAAIDGAKERTRGVPITKSVEDVTLDADLDKLRRAIVNLLTNAADAARGATNPAIAIDAGTSLDGAEVWIRVRDSGPGIDPAMRASVFDPWATAKEGGTGLGLPIARKLCEAHGGALEIEKTGAEGTTMLITVPRTAMLARGART